MTPQILASLSMMTIDQASALIAMFIQEVKGIPAQTIHPVQVDLADGAQRKKFETAVSIAAQYYLPKWTN